MTLERARGIMRPDPGRGPEPAAELRGVAKAFAGKAALAGLDLVLPRGAFLALLGPNGAGKTTALGLLLGLRIPDRGEALLLGGSPLDEDVRRRVGATPQISGFPPGLKVREIVAFVAAHYPADADLLVRRLVETRTAFSELEVLPAGLEEAFVSLTRNDP